MRLSRGQLTGALVLLLLVWLVIAYRFLFPAS